MFDGLNNNRSHWNELAEVYNAKMKAIEDEKKKLEEEEAKKCKYVERFAYCGPVDDLMRTFGIKKLCTFFFSLVHLAGDGGKSKTCTIC